MCCGNYKPHKCHEHYFYRAGRNKSTGKFETDFNIHVLCLCSRWQVRVNLLQQSSVTTYRYVHLTTYRFGQNWRLEARARVGVMCSLRQSKLQKSTHWNSCCRENPCPSICQAWWWVGTKQGKALSKNCERVIWAKAQPEQLLYYYLEVCMRVPKRKTNHFTWSQSPQGARRPRSSWYLIGNQHVALSQRNERTWLNAEYTPVLVYLISSVFY